jgi:hypothetical protein
MNAPRKKQVVALPDSHEFSGWIGLIKKHANTALTVLLLIAAVAMFIRWRMKSAEMARQSIGTELSNARTYVRQLLPAEMPVYRNGMLMPSADVLRAIQDIQNKANASISNVLGSSDADTAMRAQALELRGDLYWELANLPPVPGSTTQPGLTLTDSSDALLQKAWDAYQEVIKNSTYADQHEQLDGSHLGLAAIAENRNDWAAAKKELETVRDDSNALPVLAEEAKMQLFALPELQKKMYIPPPSGIAQTTVTPAGPPAPSLPPSTQFTLPSVIRSVPPATTKP